MKSFKEYIIEARRGFQLHTSSENTLMNNAPARSIRMKERITDWIRKRNPISTDESPATWEDLAIALDFGDLALFNDILTDRNSGTPMDAPAPEIIAELAKVLGARLDVVQKAWETLGRRKPPFDEFNDPDQVRKWLKSRAFKK